MKRLLLIEDDEDFSRPLAIGLRKAGYIVDVNGSGESGLHYAESFDYDLLLLDLNLPDLDGITICKKLKANNPDLLIFIISARDAVNKRVEGLDSGADDYLTKPFHLDELLARIRALFRRKYLQGKNQIEAGNLRLDQVKREIYIQETFVQLTAKEYLILEYLLVNFGAIIKQEELILHTWGEEDALFYVSLRTHVYNIRKKLQAAGLRGVELANIVIQGYCIRSLPF